MSQSISITEVESRLENAMTMLALRVLRANGDWNSYWQKIQVASA